MAEQSADKSSAGFRLTLWSFQSHSPAIIFVEKSHQNVIPKIFCIMLAGFGYYACRIDTELRTTMARKTPPHKTRLAVRSAHRVGRPAIEDAWSLLEIWLFVQENVYRTLRSVNAICDECMFDFEVVRSDRPLLRRLAGASLKRRYYEAEGLLKKETAEFEENQAALARFRATVSGMPTDPRLVTYWNEELMRRMRSSR